MSEIIVKNARLVSDHKIQDADILIRGQIIVKIDRDISHPTAKVIDAKGEYLLPGIIDDQVHFREPGLTHKATIATESSACLVGGITSYIEMPNTQPQTTTLEHLEDKMQRAAETSYANYSFMFGGTNDNLEAIKNLDKNACAGIKLFLGSSTGNMLVDNETVIRAIFQNTDRVISVHCEDEQTIKANLSCYQSKYGNHIPIQFHPKIRSEEACYLSSSRAIDLAKQTGARLHVFHLSTARETKLFDNNLPLKDKQITAEVCIHHLWFSQEDYQSKGSLIKWNPAVKTANDRSVLWDALLDDRIDIIATDHAPHTLQEKRQAYTSAPSGGPLVQHALPVMLEAYHEKRIPITKIVEKMCHNPAIRFDIDRRGYIREGYYADLVLVDTQNTWTVTKDQLLYKCGWSPFEGTTFQSKITHTFVNGHLAYCRGVISEDRFAMRLTFNR